MMILFLHLCTLRIPARDTLIYFELVFKDFGNFYQSKQGVIDDDFIPTFMYTSYSG